ncbi:MAG TPA: DUF6691 family protein [Thermoleophilaceae bacterium]|jgi:hypothetical protein
MTRVRVASALLGAGFGFLLTWGQFVSPDRIRQMLLFEDSYMWLMFATAVAVGFVALRLMRRAGMRSLLTGQPIAWTVARPERRHLAGAAIFGVGWAVSDVCPGPVAAQVGLGVGWAAPLIAGTAIGLVVYFRREEALGRREAPARGAAAPVRRATGSRVGAALPASNPD